MLPSSTCGGRQAEISQMARLIIESGPERGKQFRLPESGVIGIGRDEKCAVRIHDAMLSRVHCVLRIERGRWVLEDRGSLNGTIVNDSPITRQELAHGDIIQLADTLLSLSTTDEDPLIGAELGGYSIESRLGRGAMGTVYLARQLSLDRPVALKILAPRLSSDDEFIRRFLEEARAAGRLNHPNVVQVYDAGSASPAGGGHGDAEAAKLYFMSMEYLEGGTLQEWLDADGALAPEEAVAAALDAALALAFAEQNHIVHRDIKPANLLIAADGTIKVGDLGIAADLRQLVGGTAGQAAGSPRYMAPEQARGDSVDHRADVYALGATLYRSIAGVPPHDGESIKRILQAKLDTDPAPLRKVATEISAQLSSVVQKMLARDPDARYSSADDCHAALEAAIRVRAPTRRKSRARAAAPRSVSRKPAPRVPDAVRAAPRAPTRNAGRGAGRPRARTTERSPVGLVVGAGIVIVLLIATLIVVSRLRRQDPGPDSRGRTPPSVVDTARPRPDDAQAVAAQRKAAERRAALRKRDTIENEWKRGKITAREALSRVERLVDSDAAIGPLADELAATLRKAAAVEVGKIRTKAFAAFDRAFEADDLRAAAEGLDRFVAESPGEADAAAERIAKLGARLDAIAATAIQRSGELTAQGDFAAAFAAVEEARRRLPGKDDRLAKLAAADEKTTAASQAVVARREARARARGELGQRVARLDFAAADEVIASVAGAATDATRSKVEAELAPLREALRVVRGVWTRLTAGLESRHRSRALVRLELPVEPWVEGAEPTVAGRYRIAGHEGPIVRLEASSKGVVRAVSVFVFDDAALQSLATAVKVGDGLSPADVTHGIGLLLLARKGPERARVLLAPEGDASGKYKDWLDAWKDVWLDARLELLTADDARLTASEAAVPADLWNRIADDTVELIAGFRAAGGSSAERGGVRATLGDLYLRARETSLASRPRETLFHAATVKAVKDGTIELVYDFSTREQLLDFRPVLPSTTIVEWVEKRKLLRLRGEVRLLDGNPFHDRIEVTGSVPKGGYDSAHANINVALWTHEKDAVTPADVKVRDWLEDPSSVPPSDYFVFGNGYIFQPELPPGIGRFMFRRLPDLMKEPTLALLAGERDKGLHRTKAELLWEGPPGASLRGNAFRFTVEIAGGTLLRWRVNNKAQPIQSGLELSRVAEKAPHSGSVTVFTNGNDIYLAQLEVRGLLAEEWLRNRARRLATAELARVAPELARKGGDDDDSGDAGRDS